MKAAAILTDSGHIGWTNNSRRVPTKCYEVSNCWAWWSKGKSPNHKRLRSAPDWVKSDYTQILGSTSPTQLYVTAHNLTHSQTRTLSRLGIKRLIDLTPLLLLNIIKQEHHKHNSCHLWTCTWRARRMCWRRRRGSAWRRCPWCGTARSPAGYNLIIIIIIIIIIVIIIIFPHSVNWGT